MGIRGVSISCVVTGVMLLAPGCRGSLEIDPGEGTSPAVIALKDVEAPGNCRIQLAITFDQRGREPDTKVATIMGSEAEVPPLVGFDLTSSLTITVTVFNVVGERCDPFYPPATWEFTGTPSAEGEGKFSVAFSRFRKTR